MVWVIVVVVVVVVVISLQVRNLGRNKYCIWAYLLGNCAAKRKQNPILATQMTKDTSASDKLIDELIKNINGISLENKKKWMYLIIK